MRNEKERCEWKSPMQIFDNVEFKIQCKADPLERGVVPNNFAIGNFKYCPFCGRKIKWIHKHG